MKVFMINTVYPYGSTGRLLREIGNEIISSGGDYIAAYGRGKDGNLNNSYYIGTEFDRYLHAGMTRITDKCGFYSKNATKKLIVAIKAFNPDIIHLHNLHGYYVNVELLFDFLRNEYKGKVIWTLHDCWSFTGHCVHYSYRNCHKWENGTCGECQEKRRYPNSIIFDNSRNNYERKKKLFSRISNLTLVSPSKWLQQQVEKSFLGDYECNVINNGIDLSTFHMINDINQGEHILLNVVDGKDPRKGYNDVLQLAQILPDDYKIKIVGCGESKCIAGGKVELIKRTQNVEELVKYYNQAEFFINLTYEDTFPTVNMEALACGLPVITYNAGGSPETIDGNNGLVVDLGNVEAVKTAVLTAKFNRLYCSQSALQFDKNKMLKKYMELYCSVLD